MLFAALEAQQVACAAARSRSRGRVARAGAAARARAPGADADAETHPPPSRAFSRHPRARAAARRRRAAHAQNMYYQQQTTKLEAMGPMPIDPGPDLVCRMAARSFAQVAARWGRWRGRARVRGRLFCGLRSAPGLAGGRAGMPCRGGPALLGGRR